VPLPQSLSYKNQNESLKAGFFSSCFRLRSIDGVCGFWIFFRTRRAKTQGRFFEKSDLLDFLHFAIFPAGLGILDFA